MARVHLDISDFADLLREAVNRKQPVFQDKFSFGKGRFAIALEVVVHALATVWAEGSIVIVCELNTDAKFIAVEARIPKLYLEIPCTVTGGWFMVRDGTRTLEVHFDGGVTGDVQIADVGNGNVQCESANIDLRGFQVKFHVLPAWVERRLQRPIEKALEEAFERMICHTIPVSLTNDLVSTDIAGPQVTKLPETESVHHRQPGLLSRCVYTTAYYVAFGVAYPAQLIAKGTPTENAVVQGVRDGAAAAQQDVRRLRGMARENRGNTDVSLESSLQLTPGLPPS